MNNGKDLKNKDVVEDWKFNINRANEIVRLYGSQTRYFVKITLSLITTYNVIYVIFFSLLNVVGFWLLTSSFLLYLFFAILTLERSSRGKNTKNKFIIKDTYCHYSYLFKENGKENNKEILEDLTPNDFKRDYYLQLNNLLKFQKNYYDITQKAKGNMLISIYVFIIGLSLSFIINSIVMVLNLI